MKTWARRNLSDGSVSRRLELVGNLRSKVEKSPRRFRIGLSENLFAESRSSSLRAKQTPEAQPALETEKDLQPAFSKTDLTIGLAAVAGLTLGYLIGKYRN